jgi:Fe-Mn family superoxide dismutase
MSYQLPPLPYDFNALEPFISAEIMKLHYEKHHKTYVDKLNEALQKYADAESKKDLQKMIELEHLIKFNGGGNINHSIFWTNLAPKNAGGGHPPEGELLSEINKQFGSFENFTKRISADAIGIQGSGWAWLGYCPVNERIEIKTCANQDPLSTRGMIPLLGIDVWEHAYYLQYKNVRADYVKNIFNIINWKNVAERYEQAAKTKQFALV